MCVVGKMSKDIGVGVRKGTVVSFVPRCTLFGSFLGIPSLPAGRALHARPAGPKIALRSRVCVCVIITCAKLHNSVTMPL